MNSMEEIKNYYKEEVDKLTSTDSMLDSLSRSCATSINLIDSLSTKGEFSKNGSADEIKRLLISATSHVNKLKQLNNNKL
jgi:hypothetical protein